MIIYYNSECSKCSRVLGILQENNCSIEIREYLKVPPSIKELKDLVKFLGCQAMDIVRKEEPLYLEKFADKKLSEEELFRMLSNNPILIQRPIIIDGKRAIIGRPPETIFNLIKA